MALLGMQTFAADPQSVGASRAYVTSFLKDPKRAKSFSDLAEIADSVKLITSELVTNAIDALLEHIAELKVQKLPATLITPKVQVHIGVLRRMVLIGVENQIVAMPELQHATEDDEHGRGLFIVQEISQAFGWTELTGGDVASLLVWSALARPILPNRRHPQRPVNWEGIKTEFVISNLLGFRYAPDPPPPVPAAAMHCVCAAVA